MPKNIVICIDGTGNHGGRTRGTNVWRVFNSIDRHHRDYEQITYYDDGVGTDNLRVFRLLGSAFGWGLSRKIREAYEFLAINYEKGDKIFLFGFSRGAYAIRSLAGMICRCGLIEREFLLLPGRRVRRLKVKRILHAYRREKTTAMEGNSNVSADDQIRKGLGIGDLRLRSVRIHFMGVWDTVDAIGMPFKESALPRMVDRVYQLMTGRRMWRFHDQQLHHGISNAYQALALDDERKTFHPNIWDPSNVRGQITKQVWFAGVHSNVGGGYPKDSLSLIPLLWMMHRAREWGLKFLPGSWREYQEAADPHGRIYDSRTGLGMFYRYAPRNPYQNKMIPQIHESVLARIERGTDHYAPKVIGEGRFMIVRTDVRFDPN